MVETPRLPGPDPERGGAGEEKFLIVAKRLVIPRLDRGIQEMELSIVPLDDPVSSTPCQVPRVKYPVSSTGQAKAGLSSPA
jgi:hypothetical protein